MRMSSVMSNVLCRTSRKRLRSIFSEKKAKKSFVWGWFLFDFLAFITTFGKMTKYSTKWFDFLFWNWNRTMFLNCKHKIFFVHTMKFLFSSWYFIDNILNSFSCHWLSCTMSNPFQFLSFFFKSKIYRQFNANKSDLPMYDDYESFVRLRNRNFELMIGHLLLFLMPFSTSTAKQIGLYSFFSRSYIAIVVKRKTNFTCVP